MKMWRKWLALHPVQRWAIRIATWVVLLHLFPIQPYIPACAEKASIFSPPRLRPEALVETSSTMSETWWRHALLAGRIWMPPFQTSDLNFDWRGWQSNVERLIVERIANGRLTDGTRFEPPPTLLAAIEVLRAKARTAQPEDDRPVQEQFIFSDCGVQNIAFLPG